jgi:nucleotidyltransferase/DNA polymerase involved in DNA repair
MCSFIIANLLTNNGTDFTIHPYIIGNLIGVQNVETYLWIFITSTFILLGITCTIIYLRQPPDPEIIKLFLKVGGNLAALKRTQEASTTEIAEQIQYSQKVNQKFLNQVTGDLKENNKEALNLLVSQKRAIRKVSSDTISVIEKKTSETGDKISADLKRQEATINGVKRLNEESTTAIKKQQKELEEIKLKLERIEGNIAPNQSNIKSTDNPEDIKGIGPALGKELRVLGIVSVGDFLTTDPDVIGEKTRVSQEMAENLQAMAQLQMIPGIDSSDAELLIEAGIKSRKQLADYDLILLSKKVGEIAKVYLEQGKISKEEFPTIEEISSWIRVAR